MNRFAVDSRLLGAGLLAAVAAVVVLMVTRPPETTAVLVAADPAAAGTGVGAIVLTERMVLDPAGLLPVSRLDEITDHVLLVDVGPGTPLTPSLLGSPDAASEPDVVGLQLSAAAAVHGALVPGDEVDVYVTSDPGAPVVSGVTVLAVFADDGSFAIGDVGLLLAVDEDLAPVLVAAASAESIHLVRSAS